MLLAGADTSLKVEATSNLLNASRGYYNSPSVAWYDTFYSNFQLTVAGSAINQTTTLNRIVSDLEIQIQDAIPANANSIVYTFAKESPQFNFLTSSVDTAELTTTISTTTPVPLSDIGKTNVILSHIVANTLQPLVVTITCFDVNANILGTATVLNVKMYENERTVLSGKLFSGNNNFNIGINPVWGTDTTTVSF